MSKYELILEQAYEATNYGGLEKIFKFIKRTNPEIKRNDIKEFLEGQESEQLLKQQQSKATNGHIVAMFPDEFWQIDIYDLSKYKDYNKNYRYIFAVVDVFTRIAYAEKMKTKDIDATTEALEKIFVKARNYPQVCTSDNDSAFLGEKFMALLDKHKIVLDTNIKDDHNALGIIDNFAKRLKLTFGKIFIKLKTKNWIDHLDDVIRRYNNSEHSSLNDLTPFQAIKSENYNEILALNFRKRTKNKTVSDLKVGDKVRIRTSGKFTKSSEPQWSDKVYRVTSVRGTTIDLDDDKTFKRTNLLKVPIDAKDITTNVINEISKEARITRRVKKSGVERNDAQNEIIDVVKNRERKKKVIYDV
jgi:hypothetical protein